MQLPKGLGLTGRELLQLKGYGGEFSGFQGRLDAKLAELASVHKT